MAQRSWAWLLACACAGGCGSETKKFPGDGGVVVSDTGTPSNIAILPGAAACANAFCWFAPSSFGDDLHAVWAASDRDMWAVGANGTIAHYDGARWTHTAVTSAGLSAVWGSGPSSIWAVGASGTVLHFNGAWAAFAGAPMGNFNRIVATSDNDLWILGGVDAAHYDGATWTSQKLAGNVVDAKRVGGEVWILTGAGVLRLASPGATPQATALPSPKSGGAYTTLVAASPTSAWALGTNGTAAHYDGASWQVLSVGTTDIRYAAVLPNGDVFGVGSGSVFRLAATRWERLANVTGNPGVTESLKHAYVTADGHFWAVGTGGATAFYDGAKWFEAGGRPSGNVNSMHGTGSNDVWFAGQFEVHHWNGTIWGGSSISNLSFPSDVLATAADEAWAISGVFHDTLSHSKGWAKHTFDKQNFVDLSASGRDDVWAAGSTLMHYDGTAWATKTAPAGGPWKSVWQSSRSDVWLASDTGVQRGDGATWSPVGTGATGVMRMLRGTSATDVWAVYEADVRHFDGATWESRPEPSGFKIFGLASGANNEAWAWGKPGAVLHYTGGAWQEIALPTMQQTTAIWVQGAEVWVGGNDGGVFRKN
jgi:hypothetical protein